MVLPIERGVKFDCGTEAQGGKKKIGLCRPGWRWQLYGMHGTDEREKGSPLGRWLVLAIALYGAPAVVMVFDVLVFQSRLQALLGPKIVSVVNVIYWPVIKIMELLG